MLKILDEHFDNLFVSGICGCVGRLYSLGIIHHSEYIKLHKIVKTNRPNNLRSLLKTGYHWSPGKEAPRKRWINKMLKKYK